MDNATMARLLAETADLMEIDGADSFRIRSYRRAAEAAEQTTVDLMAAASRHRTPARDSRHRQEHGRQPSGHRRHRHPCRCAMSCVAKYGTGILELLKLPGMGPKTVALLWDAAQNRQHRPACRSHRGRPPGRPAAHGRQAD